MQNESQAVEMRKELSLSEPEPALYTSQNLLHLRLP